MILLIHWRSSRARVSASPITLLQRGLLYSWRREYGEAHECAHFTQRFNFSLPISLHVFHEIQVLHLKKSSVYVILPSPDILPITPRLHNKLNSYTGMLSMYLLAILARSQSAFKNNTQCTLECFHWIFMYYFYMDCQHSKFKPEAHFFLFIARIFCKQKK